MPLTHEQIEALAEHLEEAQLTATPVTKVTDTYPAMDHDDAYAVQDAIRRRKVDRGARIVGLKMGLTSFAKMAQMGVESPIRGFLPDEAQVAEGEPIPTTWLIHPKIEPELAFVTSAPLHGPGCTIEQVLQATARVHPAMEIIDSRYENFRFDLTSVIADNTSTCRFVVGEAWIAPGTLDLAAVEVELSVDGVLAHRGTAAAVLGDPAASVAMLADMLAARGEHIPAGTLILTGGITAAVPVAAGQVVAARYSAGLGELTVAFS